MFNGNLARLAFVVLSAVISTKCFALSDGWHNSVKAMGGCSQFLQNSVVYIEGGKPLSISITQSSATIENPSKIEKKSKKMKAYFNNQLNELIFSLNDDQSINVKFSGLTCGDGSITYK